VTKGPQAGTVRRGGTVNAGVHYDDVKAEGVRRPGSLDALTGEEAGGLVGDAAPFLPEHLRVLPEDPRELFAPAELTVECGDAVHTIRVGIDGAELHNHDEADSVVAALGGEKPDCFSVSEVFTSDAHVSMEMFSGANNVLMRANERIVNGVKVAAVDGDEDVDANRIAGTVGRVSRGGAVREVVRQVAESWLGSLGAAPFVGPRSQVWVNIPDDKRPAEATTTYWRVGNTAGKRPVAMYASFGDSEFSRMLLNVNEDWYDDVRENGVLFQGRLNLGTNNEGRVVADIDPKFGEVYARLVRDGEELPPLDEVLEEWRRHRAERAERFAVETEGKLCVGSYTNWEYNDETYYQTEGLNPYGYFESPADASAWASYMNVYETMFRNENRPAEYGDYFDEFPKAFQDDTDGDVFDLMNAAVNEGVPPTAFAHSFAEWGQIGPARH
jgi:hypothetical protein